MARPHKTGLDYFPIDCDILSDEKIIAVSVNCGARGIAVTFALLCAIYRNGYYALWNDATENKIAAALPGVTPDAVKKVIEILVKYDFLDRQLASSEKVLTSAAIQRRYVIGKKRRVDTSRLPYWLVMAPKTPVLAPKTPIKEKKIKISTPIVVDTETSPPPSSNGVVESSKPHTPPSGDRGAILDTELAALSAQPDWLDGLQVKFAAPRERMLAHLADFFLDCKARGRSGHDSLADAKAHFVNWLNRRLYSNNDPATTYHRPSADSPMGRRQKITPRGDLVQS